MSFILFETQRAIIRTWSSTDAKALAQLMYCNVAEANSYINDWNREEEKHGFSVYAVVLKNQNALYGFCGCREILFHDRPAVEMLWYIQREFPNDPNDDLDFETAFYIRNYLFKNYNLKSMIAFVREKDARGMNIAEEIDMESEEHFVEDGEKWLIYTLRRDSPKFLASFGDEEHEPLRTSIRNRKELTMNPSAKGRKPRLRPY